MSRSLLFSFCALLLSSCVLHKEVQLRWDEAKLEKVLDHAKDIGTFALVIQTDGEIIASFGEIDSTTRIHSVRKAILSALVFQHLDQIALEATLGELDIQDAPIPLSPIQETAKVIHLLKSTSGINHPAVSQLGSMQRDRDLLLGKEDNIPGLKWAYNNWDYNALSTIFEQETALSMEEAFRSGIAEPLGIENYDVFYRRDTSLSIHPKVGFRLSAVAMAKFGQLFLQEGRWKGQQLIPAKWIRKIPKEFTPTANQNNERFGHGYLWWIQAKGYAGGLPQGSFVATGAWGQRILVIPAWNTVVAHKTMTEIPSKQRKRVTRSEFEELVRLLSQARN